jgi:caspase domain-containing protein
MQTEQSYGSGDPSLWALLVGIDGYKAVNQLNGCVNDIEAMRTFLVNQHVSEDHILTLTDQQATRAAILSAFDEFLINNTAIAFNDQILFHYSGHGSQMPDTTGVEPDGLNETIVPYDSRTQDIYDIPDKVLASLLAQLANKKGKNITIILDSCHSGSGSRKIELPGAARIRQIPADDRIPPAGLDADLLTIAATRGAGPGGWARADIPYVLLAGCRDREFSNEYWSKSESQEGVWHGALTYFTLQALRQMVPGTTYAELYERIATQVNAIYREQTPQCEGDRDRVVFEGVRIQRDPFITVQQVEGKTVVLGAGLVHGLRQGTTLALYPPETRTREHLPPAPLTTAEVTKVTATTAFALVPDLAKEIPLLHARALITNQVYAGLKQTVALLADEGEENQQAIERLRQAIQHATPDGKPSQYLEIVSDPTATANMHVLATTGELRIHNANGELLVEPADIQVLGKSDAESVLHALESIVRYRTILALTNEGQASHLVGKVRLGLRHFVAGQPQPQPLSADAIGPGGDLTVYFYPDQSDRSLYTVDVINDSELFIYPHIFTLSPDYSIQRLYPRVGQQEAIKPGSTFSIPNPLQFYLPPGWDASHDYLKAFVTIAPTDLQMLEQKGITVPPPSRKAIRGSVMQSQFGQLLDAVTYGAGTRFAIPVEISPEEDWAMVELPITTVRAVGATQLESPAGRIPLGDGLALTKPQGFQGRVSVATCGQATRGADGDPTLKPPPGLERFPDLFQPVGRTGTRSVGSTGLVVAFDIDETSRQSITLDNPLRLSVAAAPGEQVTDLLAVAFDGEDYLLVGYADGPDAVKIVNLPPSTTTTRRGIGYAIKLFIYKKMGRYTPLTGLHRAELDNGKVVYSTIQRSQFQPGQRIAVFVHGFIDDARWMIQGLAQFLRREVLPYDHLLTWDYESFGTSIHDIGTQFALALQQQCGFGPDDRITVHVFADSMGCVVSRYMIELAGGYQFIDRLVMAGPPNRGTPLATLTRGFVYMTTELINHCSAIPPLGAISWLTKELYEQGKGWADLAVNSQLVQQLNALKDPTNVPYLALVGENIQDEQELKRANRLAEKVLHETLDKIFGEENDKVIGVSSMEGVRGGAYPALTLKMLPCDHFHYYDIPQGLAAIKQWMTSQS